MSLGLTYIIVAGTGVLIAHFISRAPDLRSMRLAQLVLVPVALVLCVYCANIGGLAGFVLFLPALLFLVLLVVPSITHHFGAGLSNLLDNYDWTPTEEELALRPIQKLIEKDNYPEALEELDELLKKHKPTYEAVLLKARLLNHFGSVDETAATLLGLIELSKTTEQQLAVMQMLASLEERFRPSKKPLAHGARRVEIRHQLVLFSTAAETPAPHKEIPPGEYEVVETYHRHQRWLFLAGEDWGNAEICWEAIQPVQSAAATAKNEFVKRIARVLQAITVAIKGKSHTRLRSEAQGFFKEASQFIRREDWQSALPLLQKASECDPDHYEIAYRWVQAVRRTSNDAVTAQTVNQVLRQSQWTENEQHMLQQLK
jgi:thioredoxin-like negative regulator of GroEL